MSILRYNTPDLFLSKQRLENRNQQRPVVQQAVLMEEISRLQQMVRAQADVIQDLEKTATEDGLTGLVNRRGWDAALAKAFANYQRYARDAAVVVLDMNFFKQINDTYGHAAGDAALLKVASVLEAETRASDLCARPGGDEFGVLLLENQPETAIMKAAHLQEILNGTVLHYRGDEIALSVSVGVATLSEADTLRMVLDLADGRLYEEKARVHSEN